VLYRANWRWFFISIGVTGVGVSVFLPVCRRRLFISVGTLATLSTRRGIVISSVSWRWFFVPVATPCTGGWIVINITRIVRVSVVIIHVIVSDRQTINSWRERILHLSNVYYTAGGRVSLPFEHCNRKQVSLDATRSKHMPPPHYNINAITYKHVISFLCRNSLYTRNVMYFVMCCRSFASTLHHSIIWLLIDPRLWKSFQQCWLTWWIFVPSFTHIPLLSTEISHHAV